MRRESQVHVAVRRFESMFVGVGGMQQEWRTLSAEVQRWQERERSK